MRSWIRKPLGAIAVVAIGAGSLVAINPGGIVSEGGEAKTANLWVDTNGGTCTRSATFAEYSDAKACSSFSTALAAASSGDKVLVRNGSYGAQSAITASKTSPGVLIEAENPGEATTGSITITSGDWIRISRINSGTVQCGQGSATNLTFDHMKINGTFWAYENGTEGGCTLRKSEVIANIGAGESDATRCWVKCYGFVMEENKIVQAPENNSHNDGFQLYGGAGLGGAFGIKLIGNWFVDAVEPSGAESILFKDGPAYNVTLSDNLIVNHKNTGEYAGATPWHIYENKASESYPFYTGYSVLMEHNTVYGNSNSALFRSCNSGIIKTQRNVFASLGFAKDEGTCTESEFRTASLNANLDYNVNTGGGSITKFGANETSSAPEFVEATSSTKTGDWRLKSGSPGFSNEAGITWNPKTASYGPLAP